ncbi:hypothetical protein CYMTET_31612 [Cymbomonas tetramitiformis]|uniref:Alpha-(1,6)-fucosyltransferase N- and catalytic domain-containing protein n=1 Tax=Cymbomonas tetramitiformis TaxID=36881 RepID=A0AAE0FGP9_9CHLO|nr:hypothetical protein CYMTET_31612 [Cymbomonas tetramitiformis]
MQGEVCLDCTRSGCTIATTNGIRWCSDVDHFSRVPAGPLGEQGTFWVRAAMVSFLMRLRSTTQTWLDLAALKKQIKFRSPLIGVHVRHGDACETTSRQGRCKGLEGYLPAIRTLAARYNTTRVYLATDDQSIITESRKYSHEFTFISTDFNRDLFKPPENSGGPENSKLIERRSSLWRSDSTNGHELMKSALIDLLLLADTDYLVLQLLSNLSRLALELSAAKKNYIPPYVRLAHLS